MTTQNTTPSITFKNGLSYDVDVYDSFASENKKEANYFGKLTKLGSVSANGTSDIQPAHPFASTFIVIGTAHNRPVARFVWLSLDKVNSFAITEADVEAMKETFAFISFFIENPSTSISKSFQKLLDNPSATQVVKGVNKFFPKQSDYSKCTYETYMMGITTTAQTPASTKEPVTSAIYKLSTLVQLMGGTWPPNVPDIAVSQIACANKGDILDFWAKVDLDHFLVDPGSQPSLTNFASLLGNSTFLVNVLFNYSISPSVTGTLLQAIYETTLVIPVGDFKIEKPTVQIEVDPLFQFAVFTIKGTIPFSIWKKDFNAIASMTIDNLEASVGVVIEEDHSSLPTPPVMKGVHFDEFGVEMGLLFEPPQYVVGVQGSFHIGESSGGDIKLDDDQFAVVCGIEDEAPNPLYASFYVPQLTLSQVVEIFTNSNTSLQVPVNFTDLSFAWMEDPMQPVVLPDGTLCNMAFGFSANIEVAQVFEFYGNLEIDLQNGVTAAVEMSPLSLGDVFEISGESKGVTIKVDAQGNPIKNNQISNTAKLQAALKSATEKTLVEPGGPVLNIQTLKQPYLQLSGAASLFELSDYSITADIGNKGMTFELDFGDSLTGSMKCTLKSADDFSGAFKFGVDRDIPLPSVGGVSMGAVSLNCTVDAALSIDKPSSSEVVMQASGSFEFENSERSIGKYTISVPISTTTDLVDNLCQQIENDASTIFKDALSHAGKYLHWIAGKVVTGMGSAADVGKVLMQQYSLQGAAIAKKTKQILAYTADLSGEALQAAGVQLDDAAADLKGAGYTVVQVGTGLKTGYDAATDAAAKALQSAGYSADQTASALNGIFTNSVSTAGSALSQAGYNAQSTASALQAEFSASASAVAGVLKDVFGEGKSSVSSILSGAGYTASAISNATGHLFPHIKAPHVKVPHVKVPHVKVPHVKVPHAKL